jgi:hypothetical protein
MIDTIITQLKTGRIKNVVAYGGNRTPATPYIVVKIEGQTVRVWIHMQPGQQLFLDDYWREDLSDLLTGFQATTRHGNTMKLYDPPGEFTVPEYSGIITHNDDGTISRERRFHLPSIMF